MSNKALNILKYIVIITIFGNHTIFASGIDKLMKYASPDGSMSNVNKAAIINDQQGGYMTGGSVILRGPRPKTLQPLTIQTPKLEFDACTGSADFRFGGLSYISSREFTQFFKNMGTASGAYAVKMLIKSSCPQCEDIMSYMETVARDVNGTMMDQCAAGQALAKGEFSMINSSSQQRCLIQGNIGKTSKDMYEASDKCKNNPDRHGNSGEEDELKSLLGNEFNLVWKALSKGSSGDLDFKELIMSISGTIIGRKIDGRFHFNNKPSLVLNNDLLEQYIGVHKKSGQVKLYKCDTQQKCLNPTETEVTLSENDTIYGNISRILENMVPKIFAGKGTFTDEEEAVIAFSSIPIIQLIEMEIIHKGKTQHGKDVINTADMIVRMQEFLEVVSYDIVTNFLMQMTNTALSSVSALEYAQLDDAVIKNFTTQVTKVRRFITDSKFSAFKRLQVMMQYKERLVLQQRSFKVGFGRFLEYNTQ
ncbi:conjugal transfer protein TraH [Rickettsia endosymbiont of Oedothorax gibbosus]|uniref:conjugal transfer protein TraH n=1 Tax=Rickettsia endosymbiont of Oedothorax gibbosus TaxID=931099 RepID=UPI002024EE5F|nr:conjugal transfer protein TraH [Rickettsia endosymbiont of Oedothorax gibbosus]